MKITAVIYIEKPIKCHVTMYDELLLSWIWTLSLQHSGLNWFVQNASLRLLACPSLMLQLHFTKRTMNKIMQKMWTLYYNQWSQHSSLVQTFDASKKLWEVILWDLPLLYPGRWVTPSMVPSSLSTLNSIYIIMYYIAYKKRWKYTYHTIPYVYSGK